MEEEKNNPAVLEIPEETQAEARDIIAHTFRLFADQTKQIAEELAELIGIANSLGRKYNMEPDEQVVALYDFLYRDSGRIASYYSQIFSGRLTSLEEISSDRESVDKAGKLNLQLVAGDLKNTQETQASSKRVIDPHDVITTDVLSFLQSNELINTDIDGAPHGSLVLAQGTLVFADRHMLELAIVVFDNMVADEERKPRSQQNKATIQGYKFIKNFLAKIPLPSAFLLQTHHGIQIAGTIKEAGMEEPISTYYFKHGTAGLSNVYMIGIKEMPSPSFTLPNTQLMGAGQQAAQALTDMLFPPEAIKVTLIALF